MSDDAATGRGAAEPAAGRGPLAVDVVSADRMIWTGEARSIIARTVDGDIGILPGHSPVLAVLVPSAVEIVTVDGNREIVAVDGGFISVAAGRVSILSEFAEMAGEVSLAEAEEDLRVANAQLEQDDDSAAAKQRLQRATAQVKAARKVA